MLMAVKRNRSLTFYQPTMLKSPSYISNSYVGGLTAASVSNSVYSTATTTILYNKQLNEFMVFLQAEKEKIAKKVADGLANNPGYKKARQDGVKLAWKYEKADIEMGGRGSADWSTEQQKEIIKNVSIKGKSKGGVRKAEGHHINSVGAHPEEQGNPNNIKFCKTNLEHKRCHRGDWRNPTEGSQKDKDKMLKNTNRKRVFKNEIRGLAIVAAIGAGIGFLIGFSVSLAQSDITPDSLKFALHEGIKTGTSAGIQTIIGYGIGRTIGQVATTALQGLVTNAGYTITENISKMCNMAVVGTITIIAFSVWQLYKAIDSGTSMKEAIIRAGKQAMFSLSLLAVSIAAQGIWGGPAGIIVSTSVGFIFIANAIVDIRCQMLFSEKIRTYMIAKSKPIFA